MHKSQTPGRAPASHAGSRNNTRNSITHLGCHISASLGVAAAPAGYLDGGVSIDLGKGLLHLGAPHSGRQAVAQLGDGGCQGDGGGAGLGLSVGTALAAGVAVGATGDGAKDGKRQLGVGIADGLQAGNKGGVKVASKHKAGRSSSPLGRRIT